MSTGCAAVAVVHALAPKLQLADSYVAYGGVLALLRVTYEMSAISKKSGR
jgi:hypothetical protein